MLSETARREIVDTITRHVKCRNIILFGSQAQAMARPDSDIDLVVVLDEPGISHSFKEKMDRKFKVGSLLIDIKRRIPVDLLVYTKDEWALAQKNNSSLMREINETGVQIA
jgi:predicted nucleotidyltransferase